MNWLQINQNNLEFLDHVLQRTYVNDKDLPFLFVNRDGELISKLNAQSGSASEDYYLDLISGSLPSLTPSAPAEIPSLSDGPHLAYAVQWILFAGLVVYGRYLIRKMDLTSGEVLPSKEL